EAADPRLAEVDDLLAKGKKIQAIKVYREATGAGLAEAKEAVERRAG
ncbi:ribosomal protein L7/L12, partial [Streptomyces sp. NRRL F-4489]